MDDDVLHSSRLGPVSLWGADPWALLALTHPARTEATGHLVGLGLGVRQLLALATAVEAMAGHEALMRFPVVIACHEGQVDAVVKDLSSRRLCRCGLWERGKGLRPAEIMASHEAMLTYSSQVYAVLG